MKKLGTTFLFFLLATTVYSQPNAEFGTPVCDWGNEFFRPGLDDRIEDMVVFNDGNGDALYAAGFFQYAGGVGANRVAKWDGTQWSALGGAADNVIYALAVFDDGNGPALYAGGFFTSVEGILLTNGIAKWDGSAWSSVGGGITSNGGSVRSMLAFDDGSGTALFVGGNFSQVGGVNVTSIAKWDGTTWTAAGSLSTWVRDMIVFDDARGGGPALYAGGSFSGGVAKWDGSAWATVGTGMGGVNALAVYDEGQGFGPALYAGGGFSDNAGRNNIARWDGISWTKVANGLNTEVRALATYNDGTGNKLYAGGQFTTRNGTSTPELRYIAQWSGTSWDPVGDGMNLWIQDLIVFNDGSGAALYAGGNFSAAGETGTAGVVANRLAKWNGTAWSTAGFGDQGEGVNDTIRALETFDQVLYNGGDFSVAGTGAFERIAGWNGTHWSGLGTGFDGDVRAVAVYDDGNGPALYAAGDFSFAGLLPVNRIAKWDGSAWVPVGTGLEGTPHAMAVFDDGNGPALYVGGDLTMAGDVEVRNIAKWDGTSWSTFNNGLGGPVYALKVFNDGTGPALFMGGQFFNVGGSGFPSLSARNIAKWTGTSWLVVRTGLNSTVYALEVFDDGGGPALYVGGEFTNADGLHARNIAKWDGFMWSIVGGSVSGGGVDNDVRALAAYHDGGSAALYVGGEFTSADGMPANRLARWNGTAWSALGSGMNNTVHALKVANLGNGSELFAAGEFNTADGRSSDRMARYFCRAVDLGLDIVASVEPVVVGSGAGNLIHTLTITNNGTADASGVTVSLDTTLPIGVSVDSSIPTTGNFMGNNWNVGNLASGASADLVVTLTVAANTPQGIEITSDAEVTAVNELDTNAANDTASLSSTTDGSADLSITKDDSADPVELGESFDYTLVIANAGPSDALGVVVTETLPADVTLTSTSGCAEDPAADPTCSLGFIAAGISKLVTVTVSVDPSASGTLVNNVSVTSATSDPNPGNNITAENTVVADLPPEITGVNTVPDTGDGALMDCESTRVAVEQIHLSFSEALQDPPGHSSAVDVTNPSSYRLIEAGTDGDFATQSCAAVLGDDVAVVINAVSYNADTAELILDAPLADGLYRLFTCDGALQDASNNNLDSYSMFWRVDQDNAFVNNALDCTLEGWTTFSILPEEVTHSDMDVDGSTHSGSAWLRNLSGTETFSIGQCIEPVGLLEIALLLEVPGGEDLELSWGCESFDAPACTGASLGVAGGMTTQGDTAGTWQTLGGAFRHPAGTVSALCSYEIHAAGGVDFDAYLDNASAPSWIFVDGFESGDLSRWEL